MTPKRGNEMLLKCQKCGIIFKTDNPERKTCYDCKAELQFTVQFPDAIELQENKKARKH
jgi:uncharacterized OB-fold protein